MSFEPHQALATLPLRPAARRLRRLWLLLSACALGCNALATELPAGGRFAQVDQAIRQAHQREGGDLAMAVRIYDKQDRLVYGITLGGFDPDRRGPVASASKIVAASVILSVVDSGALTLDSSTQQILGWTGERGRITLRQLLGLVAGLSPQAACMNEADISLAQCVERIRDDPSALRRAPGTQFDYGGSTFQVAARMAEVATGKSWQTLFTEHLGRPLALPPEVNFYTAPWLGLRRAGNSNPRVGGGLLASMNDYAALLAVVFHQGQYRGHQFASEALFRQMGTEPHPEASIGNSPMATASGLPVRYGLGSWLECVPAKPECQQLSSAGAFGWTPWIDRESGYYALVSMFRAPSGGLTSAPGVVAFSVQLQQQLKPLISQAMAR